MIFGERISSCTPCMSYVWFNIPSNEIHMNWKCYLYCFINLDNFDTKLRREKTFKAHLIAPTMLFFPSTGTNSTCLNQPINVQFFSSKTDTRTHWLFPVCIGLVSSYLNFFESVYRIENTRSGGWRRIEGRLELGRRELFRIRYLF